MFQRRNSIQRTTPTNHANEQSEPSLSPSGLRRPRALRRSSIGVPASYYYQQQQQSTPVPVIVRPARRTSIGNGNYKYQGPLPESLRRNSIGMNNNQERRVHRRGSIGPCCYGATNINYRGDERKEEDDDDDSSHHSCDNCSEARCVCSCSMGHQNQTDRSIAADTLHGAAHMKALDRKRFARTRRRHSICMG